MSATGFNRRRREQEVLRRAEEEAFMQAMAEEDEMVAEVEAQGLDPELCLMTNEELEAYAKSISDDYVFNRRKARKTLVQEIMALEAVADEGEDDEDDVDEVKESLMAQLDNCGPEDYGFADDAQAVGAQA